MMKFLKPKKQKMASGNECLELTEEGTRESFPPFAEKYVKQIGAKVLKKIEAPDIHLWEIEFEGVVLNFVYDDFPNGISIEPKDKNGQAAIEKLYKIALAESDHSGL
jgi:hypothetical protein